MCAQEKINEKRNKTQRLDYKGFFLLWQCAKQEKKRQSVGK
jgi:hypothetical protein